MYDSAKQIGSRRLAILIDGDNAQPSLLEKMLSEASKYGTVTVRRTYGDWTTSNMGGWKDTLQTHAIQPIQQFRYTIGKNATDSAMIIDAMDLLHSGTVDAFCLVSSDSDYTRLATRIREKGFFVMGIGQKKTPRAFVNACDVFVYTENLVPPKPQKKRTSRKKDTTEPKEPPSP
ncbi:MAG TPA: NYN domain-containing protein, partial [Pelolinea sp.]|nr:NYN domain-containing protein [Pelolinea sp.]